MSDPTQNQSTTEVSDPAESFLSDLFGEQPNESGPTNEPPTTLGGLLASVLGSLLSSASSRVPSRIHNSTVDVIEAIFAGTPANNDSASSLIQVTWDVVDHSQPGASSRIVMLETLVRNAEADSETFVTFTENHEPDILLMIAEMSILTPEEQDEKIMCHETCDGDGCRVSITKTAILARRFQQEGMTNDQVIQRLRELASNNNTVA